MGQVNLQAPGAAGKSTIDSEKVSNAAAAPKWPSGRLGKIRRAFAEMGKKTPAPRPPVEPRSFAIKEVPTHIAVRFWRHVDQFAAEECWPWRGGTTSAGYGRFKIGGKLFSSHRLAFAIANGSVPKGSGYHGTVIMHTCDNPRCCNPAHLRSGTNRDNAQDMAAKGRNHVPSYFRNVEERKPRL